MTMPRVSFGVPVYNGGGMIAECLDCLVNQTLSDIEIVVSDNASTDNTGEIVAAYAARDPRIRYIRQPTNIGLMKNFKAVVDAAGAPYFILRCHDDKSSLNYAQALLNGLLAHPGAKLAVPKVETLREGKAPKFHPIPVTAPGRDLGNIRRLLFGSHAAWFCGLWEYSAFKPVFDRVWACYDSPWGPDHLTVYPFIIAQQVVLVPEAIFIQRITPKSGVAKHVKPNSALMRDLRGTFLEECAAFRRERNVPPKSEAVLAALTWLHTGKRVYRARKIWQQALLAKFSKASR
jgi:glycosyltransferase involved in cell wall biosynthesis